MQVGGEGPDGGDSRRMQVGGGGGGRRGEVLGGEQMDLHYYRIACTLRPPVRACTCARLSVHAHAPACPCMLACV